jgi:hypothetical protein
MAKDEKQISIVIAASGEVKDVAVSPGATVEDIKSETGLKGYQISRKGGEPLSSNADIFVEVADGEKLYATPEDVSVGSGGSAPIFRFITALKEFWESLIAKVKTYLEQFKKRHLLFVKRVRLIRTRYIAKSLDHKRISLKRKYKYHAARVVGKDKEYAYWQENGWRKTGNKYRGFFRTKYGAWNGVIIENYHNDHSFYIFTPPDILKKSDHWECFTHKGNGLYSIHFSRKPKDISSGILTVEQLITESFEGGRKDNSDV